MQIDVAVLTWQATKKTLSSFVVASRQVILIRYASLHIGRGLKGVEAKNSKQNKIV